MLRDVQMRANALNLLESVIIGRRGPIDPALARYRALSHFIALYRASTRLHAHRRASTRIDAHLRARAHVATRCDTLREESFSLLSVAFFVTSAAQERAKALCSYAKAARLSPSFQHIDCDLCWFCIRQCEGWVLA
jgi:hypothetical protein